MNAIANLGRWLLPYLACALGACSAATVPVVKPPPPAPSPTPIQQADKITKPLNVSFSTYSTDWPVGWQWIDPGEKDSRTPHDVKRAVLAMTVPTGKDLTGDVRNAPRYLKALTGDLEIETRVSVLPKENFQAAGLLVYWNELNYIRLERSFSSADGEGVSLRLRDTEGLRQISRLDISSDPTDLKIIRKANIFTSYCRAGETEEWRKVGEIRTDYPDILLVGLGAYNTAEPLNVDFKYIRLRPVK